MAGDSETLRLVLTGIDASASRALQAVGRQAMETSRHLASIGTAGAKLGGGLTAGVQAAGTLYQTLQAAGPAAGVLAPALLTAAQAMGTLRLVSDEAGRQLETLRPQFDAIKTAAERAFSSGGFSAAVKILGTNLDVVKEGVASTAKVFGELALEAAEVFSGPAFRSDLAALMESNTQATRNLGQAGIWLAGAFWDVAMAAKDVWVELTAGLESGAKTLALWIEQKRESGELTAAIRNGVQTIKDLFTSIRDIAVGIGNLLDAAGIGTENFSAKLADGAAKFREWTEEGSTVQTVTAFFTTFREVAGEALDYVNLALGAFRDGWTETNEKVSGEQGWLQIFRDLGEQARSTWTVIRDDLLPALEELGDVLLNDVLPPLASIAAEIKDTFVKAVGAAARIIRDDLVPVLRDDLKPLLEDTILPAVRWLADLFETKLIPAGEKLANTLSTILKPALDELVDVLSENSDEFRDFADAVEKVANALLPLAPLLIALTAPMWIAIGIVIIMIETFGLLVNALRLAKSAIEEVIGWIVELAAKFGITRDDIERIVGEIIGFFINLKNEVMTIFSDSGSWLEKAGRLIMLGLKTGIDVGWGVVKAFFGTVKSAVTGFFSDAGGWLLQAGRNIVGGLISGLSEKLGDLRSKVGEIAGAVKDFFPNSPAKTGPLKESPPQTWGENLVDYIGQGMRAGQSALDRTVGATAASLAIPPPTAAGFGVGTVGGGAASVVVNLTLNLPNALSFDRRVLEMAAPYLRDAINNNAGSNGRRTGLPR